MDQGQLVLMGIALVAPFIVWGVRAIFPSIPALVLPALATALGPALDWLAALSTGTPAHGIVVQLLAGGAAVALREIVDQAKKATGISPPSS